MLCKYYNYGEQLSEKIWVLISLCRENLTLFVILEIEKSWIRPGCILLLKLTLLEAPDILFFIIYQYLS